MNAEPAPRLQVLVVDDDPDFSRTLSDILRMQGYGALTADTARRGIELAQGLSEPPQIALIDLRLPDMDGLELVEHLRRISALTQVVILTGHASLASAVEALRHGSFDYLAKPVSPADLFRTLEAARTRWHREIVEDVVHRERERQAEILEASPTAMMIIDRHWRVEYLNGPAEAMLGVSRNDVLGSLVREGLPGIVPVKSALNDDERVFEHVLRTGETLRDVPHVGHRTDGTTFDLLLSAAPLRDADGRIQAVVESLSDVTELRRLEETLRRQQQMEAVGRLAGGVAHDFNNLLTVIKTSADLLMADAGRSVPSELEAIRDAAQRAQTVTRQLLTVSRPTPEAEAATAAADLNEQVRDLRALLGQLLHPGHGVVMELEEALPPVRMSSEYIQQMLLNLCINARDAMTGDGTMTIRTRRASPPTAARRRTSDVRSWVSIEVSDTGEGIAESVRSSIFEPFFTTKPPGKGTGLGLSMVYRLVTEAGGEIEFESEVGRGTTFLITLPEAAHPVAAPAAALDVPSTRETEAPPVARPCTILIVDDEDAVRSVASRTLTRHGHTVLQARSGDEAMMVAEQLGSTLAVLVTDYQMPGTPPEKFVPELAEYDPDLGLVLLSGADLSDAPSFIQRSRRWAFVRKPFEISDLLRAVERVQRR